MKLATKVVLFIAIWLGIYALGFLYYRSLSGSSSDPLEGDGGLEPPPQSQAVEGAATSTAGMTLAEQKARMCAGAGGSPAGVSAGLVVAYGGAPGEREQLLRLVRSVQTAAGSRGLREIVVVDDHTYGRASDWPEWHDAEHSLPVKVSVRPNTMRRGSSAAKAAGASALLPEVDVLVFLESSVVVTDGWLQPLLRTLNKHPHSVVYPSVDLLSFEGVHPAANTLAAFDWALGFRWEDAEVGAARLGGQPVGYYEEAASPALPASGFAVTSHYYSEIGGLPLTRSFGAGREHLELSLRVWLCGGGVIRVPCSRVAVAPRPPTDVIAGINQEEVDVAVLSIAELWMGRDFADYAFRARFTGRVPYSVQKDPNAHRPPHVEAASAIAESTCASFDWFVEEIYPGLAIDAPEVLAEFQRHIESDYIEKALHPHLVQYRKAPAEHGRDDGEVGRLEALAEQERAALKSARVAFLSSQQEHAQNGKGVDKLARHEDEVKHNLLCEDYPLGDCESKAKKGDCANHQPATIFQCPVSCGLCDTEGQFCSDLYLGKCPIWKKEGRCETDPEFVEQNCRFTCGLCTRADGKTTAGGGKKLPVKLSVPPKSLAAEESSVDATSAHRRYLGGQLPDAAVNSCALKGTPNGQLMDVMRIEQTDALVAQGKIAPVRIFCGIYTMESNHKTSVKSTIETWGKRCDGFIAFSTVTDPEYSAYRIEHEGEESYNNMWQKSRAIWKHIGKHYAGEYDFFLLGGDDMWFVVENLRAYLGSAEIQAEAAAGKGLYIGRRFFPPKQNVFNSGGAGAILDKVALKVLTEHIDNPPCRPHQVGFWEDVNVAFCLAETGKILPYDTRDEFGRERFHPFTPGQHLAYRIPPKTPDWYAKYNPELKVGVECCSELSVSFHYAKGDVMRKLHNYMYNCPQKPSTQDRSHFKL